MAEAFLAEKKRFKENWERVSRILKENKRRYGNKNDVIEEALNCLEDKLNAEKSS